MNIYIEYVILNNLIVNAMILYLTGCILKRDMKTVRIVASSLIGTIYAVFLPYISFRYDFFIKIILSFFMIIIAFRVYSVSDYVKTLLLFYVITFSLGGIIIGCQNIGNSLIVDSLLKPNSLVVSMIGLVVIAMAFIAKHTIYVCSILYKRKKYTYDIILSNQGKILATSGYLDSGNKLYYKTKPVIVIDEKILSGIVNNIEIDAIDCVALSTISGDNTEPIYSIDKVELIQNNIHKFYENIYAIRSSRPFSNYKILLHCDM